MVRKSRTVHIDKITNTVKGVTYTSYYLRRTFRQDGKVKHETLGNLSYAFRQFHAPLEIYRGLQTVLIVSVSSRTAHRLLTASSCNAS